jgi:hypothetical protein
MAPEEGERMARRIALNMEQIIGGIPPEDLPVPMSMDEELVINARTAMQIGFSPDLDLMTRSLFLHEECLDAGTRLELEEAIELALENNIDLAVERAKVGEKRQDRNKYLSNLFPQLDGNANYTQIDRDRAESSMGSQPEKETKIGATVSQIIFNDSALSAYRSSRRQFNSAQADQETTRLDVFADTARSFIELLQARALVRIDANNLNLTRSNLELARIRQQVGTAGPEEVLRWETQAAQQKADLIKSLSNMDKAQVALNQIMGLNLSSRWWPVDIQLSPTNYWFMGDRLAPYLRNDAQLKALEGYIEELAVRNSTELAALDENIAAQRIMLDLYRRQFIVPELGANFAYDRILKQETVGDNGGLLASEADDNEWSFGVQASLPLFQSGGQVFTVLRARAVLEQLTQTRRLTAERIRQQAKNVMYSLESSYPSMKLQQGCRGFCRGESESDSG